MSAARFTVLPKLIRSGSPPIASTVSISPALATSQRAPARSSVASTGAAGLALTA